MKKRRNAKTAHITTLVSSATEVTGDIHFSGTLEIEGKVSGHISADSESEAEVRVREGGYVSGSIKVPNIVINGLVEGDVYAGSQLELAAKARVVGNVYYCNMEMVLGAEVNGSLQRHDGQEIKRLGVDKPEVVSSRQAVNT